MRSDSCISATLHSYKWKYYSVTNVIYNVKLNKYSALDNTLNKKNFEFLNTPIFFFEWYK